MVHIFKKLLVCFVKATCITFDTRSHLLLVVLIVIIYKFNKIIVYRYLLRARHNHVFVCLPGVGQNIDCVRFVHCELIYEISDWFLYLR
jgi:type II secretory pathway component PulF